MKIRIQGERPDVMAAVEKIKKSFDVLTVSKPYKNRASEEVRVYLDVELMADKDVEQEIRLVPSLHGKDCPGSGDHPEYPDAECCCDNCDHYLICFPEYRE